MDENKLKILVNEGKNYEEIALELNCNERTVEKYAKKLGLKVTTKIIRRNDPEVVNKIKQLLSEGKTNTQIAKELSISPTTARRYTRELIGQDTNSVKAKSLKEVSLSKNQLEIIYGSLLGDMAISKTPKSARFAIGQGGLHEEYFDYVCSKFPGLLGKVSKTPRFDKRTNKWYNKFVCRSLANEKYLEIYNELYINDKKTITREYLDKITAQGIAYWFMDDGSINGDFATNCFTEDEVKLLQEMFLNKFNINTRIKQVTGKEEWLLIVKSESRKDFENLIKPYMHESMYYKLKYRES